MNPTWQTPDGTVQLYLGDALLVLPHLGLVDAVICDPPYGTTQSAWDFELPLQAMWKCLDDVTGNDCPVVLFCAEPFASDLRASNRKSWRYDWVWEKSRPTRFLDAKRMPLAAHELICVFGKSRPKYFPQMAIGEPSHGGGQNSKPTGIYHAHDKTPTESNDGVQYPRSVIKFPSVAPGAPHPNQKPLPLVEYLVKTYSVEGDAVLDFTFGSGTTGVAAVRHGRKFIGIEREQKYLDLAVERIGAELNRAPLFESPTPLAIQQQLALE